MGLTDARLRAALSLGVRRFNGRADGLPPSFAGTIPTAEAKAALARLLGAVKDVVDDDDSVWVDDGWRINTACDLGSEAFSIKVWVGDELTGMQPKGNEQPRPRNSKGPETRRDVNSNDPQLGLFDTLPDDIREWIHQTHPSERIRAANSVTNAEDDARLFVVLLFRYEFVGRTATIYWELSVPDRYDESAQTVSHWVHRQIFEPFTIDLDAAIEDTYEDGEDPDPSFGRD
ncbi:hypothetical protein ACNOYE_08340 [Nannocystaceae bacterium ST9]